MESRWVDDLGVEIGHKNIMDIRNGLNFWKTDYISASTYVSLVVNKGEGKMVLKVSCFKSCVLQTILHIFREL